MSQWYCKQCGAIRARPHRYLIRGDERLIAVFARPCKRCGSHHEPDCRWDPWLDIDEEGSAPSLAGRVAA